MAGLVPFAQIVDLQSDAVLASTQNIIDYSVEWCLDKVGTLSIEVSAGDAGDGAGGTAFAAALLEAASDLGAAPRPLLLEFSLDGGTSVDSRKMVEQPQRTLKASERTIKEDGADLAATLSTVPQERVTYTDCKLGDVFNGPDNGITGSITPIAANGINPGPIPYLHGLLTVAPGKSGWAGSYRLTWTGVIDPIVQQTATNVDVDSATTLAAAETVVNRLAGAFISGDSVPQGYRGHYVADPSDSALNLGGQARSFVVGNVAASASGGSTTTPHLTFDATGAHDLDEPFPEDGIARLHLDSATLKTDDTTLVPACNFVGGKSTAGFPQGSKVTALSVLNAVPGQGMTTTRDAWQDALAVIGVNVNDTSGGLYFTILDGTIRPLPNSPATACLSLAIDAGDAGAGRPTALLMGTPNGVYITENTNLLNSDQPWTLLGDLNAKVARLNVKIDPGDTTHRVVFAFVKGTGEREDGVYRWTHTDGWNPILVNSQLVDMIATDYLTFWVIKKADQTRIYRYAVGTGAPSPSAGFQLPLNADGTTRGQAYALQEVVTAAHGAVAAQDSVWALVSGATATVSATVTPTPAFYLVNVSGSWGTFYNANVDGTLHADDGTPLQLNRVVGLGISFDGTYATAFAGTDSGVYYTIATLGAPLAWKSANLQGGLANYNVKSIAAGQYQVVLGEQINRIYCTTESDLLYSSSSGRWWETIAGRDRTVAGTHLSTIALLDAADLPASKVRTWGTAFSGGAPMTTSPIGGSVDTHVYVPPTRTVGGVLGPNPDAMPDGFWYQRYLDQHLDYQYKYVNQDCPFAGLQMAQLPDLQANAAVDADTASAGVITVAKRWLPQHAVPQTVLSVESSFSDDGAALRSLRPTHVVRVNGSISITDVSGAGTAVTTRVWDAANAPMYVLQHTLKKGPGMTCYTTTDLGTQLFEKLPTESDLGNALQDQVAALRVWR